MSPCPISGHQVSVLPFLVIEFPIRDVVNMALKVWTCEDVLDDLARVPIPDVILCRLPFWMTSCPWEESFIFEVSMLPLNVAKVDRVDLSMEIEVVGDGDRVVMGDQCCSP